MKGMIKGLMAGMMIGGTAATMFGIMNWQTERKWNQQLRRGGHWVSQKADQMTRML